MIFSSTLTLALDGVTPLHDASVNGGSTTIAIARISEGHSTSAHFREAIGITAIADDAGKAQSTCATNGSSTD